MEGGHRECTPLIYIYIYMYVVIYQYNVSMYVYIYIYREREREYSDLLFIRRTPWKYDNNDNNNQQ